MLDRILDAFAVLSPLAIAIMSVLVGIRLAKDPADESHRNWWWAIVSLGVICSGVTLWQQERARKAHTDEVGRLNSFMDDLRQNVRTSETARAVDAADFKARLDVIGQFVSHPPANLDSAQLAAAVHAMAQDGPEPKEITIRACQMNLLSKQVVKIEPVDGPFECKVEISSNSKVGLRNALLQIRAVVDGGIVGFTTRPESKKVPVNERMEDTARQVQLDRTIVKGGDPFVIYLDLPHHSRRYDLEFKIITESGFALAVWGIEIIAVHENS